MDVRPIRTKTDYRAALNTIESLMHAKANTPEGDRQRPPEQRATLTRRFAPASPASGRGEHGHQHPLESSACVE